MTNNRRPPAVLFDRDGTLASVEWVRPSDRSSGEWARYNAALPFDAVVPTVAGLLRAIRPGVTRIMVSGRAEGDFRGDRRRRYAMEGWIAKHQLPIDLLLMRRGGDQRRDSIVKAEMYREVIEPRFDVRYAVDDREQVITECWERLGVPVLRVTDPGITPSLLLQEGAA